MKLSSLEYTKQLRRDVECSWIGQPDWAYQRDLALLDEIDRLNNLLCPKCNCDKCTGLNLDSYYKEEDNDR